MTTQQDSSDRPFLEALPYVVYAAVILYFGKSVWVPFSFALLVSFALYPVSLWFERRGIGKSMAIILSIALLILFFALIIGLLIYQFYRFLQEWQTIQSGVEKAMLELGRVMIDVFNISEADLQKVFLQISDKSATNALSVAGDVLSGSATSLVALVLIPVYVFLILYHRRYAMKILNRMFSSQRDFDIKLAITQTITTYHNFIKGMAIVYLFVGCLNSLGLLLLGVPNALLFGFVASILTFIPYVGIIAGSLLPMAVAWVTYDSIWYPIGVVAVFALVQYLEANVIFPMAVSRRLRVNMLVMLMAIFIGGVLWGVAGMILFVPFIGIAKLIADKNPKWRTWAMILGPADDE